MKAPALPIYTETLGESLDAVRAHFGAKGFTFADNSFDFLAIGGVSYETTRSGNIEAFCKGKRKFVHVSLYRMPSGRYELTAYSC